MKKMKIGLAALLIIFALLVPVSLFADECLEGNCDNGLGTGFTEDGKIYEGEWKDGYPHGKGTLVISKEKIIKGEWAKGKLVKEETEKTGKASGQD